MAPNAKSQGEVVQEDNKNGGETSTGERKEILYEGYFYDVTEWIRRHPGGKIIEFYTKKGEDATIPVQEFHNRSTKRVNAIMQSLKKRPATPQELGLDQETIARHAALTKDFQALHKELEEEGFFKPSIPHVVYRLSELLAFLVVGLYLISFRHIILTPLGILSFALFQGRSGWLMHEGGHHSLTGIPNVDRFIQAVVYGFGDGMSSSWWSSQHNRHHAMPQRLQHDVDLETLPLLAFNKKVVKNPKKQGQNYFIQHQATLFLLVDTLLVATMWKIYLHPRYVIMKGTYHQLFFMAAHYLTAYYVGFVPYIISVWLASIYIFGNFSLSHTHLPVTSGPMHWVEYALLHTMDVEQKPWCNWWMSYLNYQIEHHLFPTMPQFRHPRVAKRVEVLAKKHGIPYHNTSYVDALYRTFENLAEVSKDLRHGGQ